MKKEFLFLIFTFFTFFFFSCFSVKAESIIFDDVIDLDANNHFNYYYEAVSNTAFYRFVNGKGKTFESYLSSFNIPTNSIFFSYAKDFNFVGLDSIPENAYYVIAGSNVGFYFDITDGGFHINFKYGDSSFQYYQGYLVFDKEMNLLDKYIKPESSNYFYFFKNSFDKFIYLSGAVFKGIPHQYDTQSDFTFSIRYTDLFFKGKSYNISGLKTRSKWSNFWASLFSFGDNISLESFGLEYFSLNLAYKYTGYDGDDQFGNISDVLYYDPYFYSNISVPNGYVSSTFNYSSRKLLIPKKIDISNVDSILYFSSSDTAGINFISYDILEDSFSYKNLQTYSFSLHKANYIEAVSLKSILSNSVSDNYYIIYSSDNISDNTIYYNPDVFYIFDLLDSNNITFVNPNSNNEINLSPAERQIINQHIDKVNDSIVPSDDLISDYSNISITDIFDSAWSGAKTFISASFYIVGMVSNLFSSLPSSVSSLILCVFTVGMVAVLWKIFH